MQQESASPALWSGCGTILLVDDEESIRSLGSEMLEVLGFGVLTADDGLEALEVVSRRSEEISVIILDLTMPHMDGEETFRELRRLGVKVPVIMSSGYNEYEISQRFLGKGLAGFVQKPYKLAELSLALEKVLGSVPKE
jgi:CheY-like chemotaxis protein